MAGPMAEYVKNNRIEFEKALGLDMVWLASEMSRPQVGMMTEEEYENIKTPRLLTEAQKRGAIVDALVRTLELDTNGRNLALFLQILEKKPQQYKKAISMLKGNSHDGGQASPPSQQAYQPAPGSNALPGYYQNFGPPQPPGGYQPSSSGQQPQHQQPNPPQQYGFSPQQQGWYYLGPPQNGHYPQAQNYGANVPNGSYRAPNPEAAAAVPGQGFYSNSMLPSAAVGSGGAQPLSAQHQPAGEIVVRSEDVNFLMTYLHKNAYKWREIGSSLGFLHGELENISHSNPRATTSQLLTTLLNQWCQWPTSDHPHHPTMERLRDALRSGPVGLGAAANDLYAQRNSLPSRKKS